MNLVFVLMLLFVPGQYLCHAHPVYVGIEHELPDPSVNEIYPACRDRLRLTHGMHEERRIVAALQAGLPVTPSRARPIPRTRSRGCDHVM